MTDRMTDPVGQFLALSAELTGFRVVDLQGTGMAQLYYDEVTTIVGERICGELWSKSSEILEKSAAGSNLRAEELGRLVLGDPKLGPVCRSIIQMWYLGTWAELPPEWRDAHGATARGGNHVVSGEAYREGLVWAAIGAHPMGAKQSGFGSWGLKPGGTGDE
jgi:hypothetical protein